MRKLISNLNSARFAGMVVAAIVLTGASGGAARADSAGATLSQGDKFTEKTGQEIYANVCQACHMSKGEGAVGAGKYPALAKNENLESSGYPVTVILNGQKAMPPLGSMLSDDQIAAVVNYVRTNFGNNYKDAVKPEDVKDVR